jgi:hypothetical protein
LIPQNEEAILVGMDNLSRYDVEKQFATETA